MSASPEVSRFEAEGRESRAQAHVLPLNPGVVSMPVAATERAATASNIDLKRFPDRWGEYIVERCRPTLDSETLTSLEALVDGQTGEEVQPALDYLAALMDNNKEILVVTRNAYRSHFTTTEFDYMKRLTGYRRKAHEHARTLSELSGLADGVIGTKFGLRFAETVDKLLRAEASNPAPLRSVRPELAAEAEAATAEEPSPTQALSQQGTSPTDSDIEAVDGNLYRFYPDGNAFYVNAFGVELRLPAHLEPAGAAIAEPQKPLDAVAGGELAPGDNNVTPVRVDTLNFDHEIESGHTADEQLTPLNVEAAVLLDMQQAKPEPQAERTAQTITVSTAQQELAAFRDKQRHDGGYLDAQDIADLTGYTRKHVQRKMELLIKEGKLPAKGGLRMRPGGTRTRHLSKAHQEILLKEL